MTALEAIQQARQTGQIAITKETAQLLSMYLEFRERHNELCKVASSRYADKDTEFDELNGRLNEPLERYLEICRREMFSIIEEGLCNTDFKGL